MGRSCPWLDRASIPFHLAHTFDCFSYPETFLHCAEMEQKSVRLDDIKASDNGTVQGTYLPDEGEHWIGSIRGPVAAKYQGTAADKQDMSVLGRDQVLRVSKHWIRCNSQWTLTANGIAQLPFHLHRRIWMYTYQHMGSHINVSTSNGTIIFRDHQSLNRSEGSSHLS